ncbi:MAG: MaoC family dehydratase [Sandaracinaceae bacterium]
MIRAMAATVVDGWRRTPSSDGGALVTPGPEVTVTLPPRSDELLDAYVAHVGGRPELYRGRVPPHLFPQWSFGLTRRVFEGLPFSLVRALNGGCRLIQRAPLPRGEPLACTAWLHAVDESERRVLLEQRIVTGTDARPAALEAHFRVFVPRPRARRRDGPTQKRWRKVPLDVELLAEQRIGAGAGRDFATLTGDINPVHWLPPYARALGHRSVILHGFGTLARCIEVLNREVFQGDVDGWRSIDVRFTHPLVLPWTVGVFRRGDEVWVGDAPNMRAYLEGAIERTPT